MALFLLLLSLIATSLQADTFAVSDSTKILHIFYHHISYVPHKFNRRPHDFEDDLRQLRIYDFHPITLTEYSQFLKGKLLLPRRCVIISFDDGYADAVDNAIPLLNKYGFKGVFFIIGNMIGKQRLGGYCSFTDLHRVIQEGHDVQSHTWSHPYLNKLGHWTRWDKELGVIKMVLEEELGIRIHAICYPYGMTNNEVVSKVAQYNYDLGFTCKNGLNTQMTDPYLGHRDEINATYTLESLLISYKKQFPEWFK